MFSTSLPLPTLIAIGALMAGAMLLHVNYVFKPSPVYGLYMPLTCLILSIGLCMLMNVGGTEAVNFQYMFKVFCMLNIPTVIMLVIYFFARTMMDAGGKRR